MDWRHGGVHVVSQAVLWWREFRATCVLNGGKERNSTVVWGMEEDLQGVRRRSKAGLREESLGDTKPGLWRLEKIIRSAWIGIKM